MTFHDEARGARVRLIEAGILPDTATRDADLLARHALHWDLATWLAQRREPSHAEFKRDFDRLITRRLAREPVAYIRGVQEFWGREFVVTPEVLIPRPETELLIEHAILFLRAHPDATVVDVGTGSGCIATTLALEFPDARVNGTDISGSALTVAKRNAERLGAQVTFHEGSMLADLREPIDLIVSNPPYVAETDRPGLSQEVRDHEPAVALYGGADGWEAIRSLLALTPTALTDEGQLLMEMGFGQSERLEAEVARVPSLQLEAIIEDLQGIPRLVTIRRRRR